MNVLIIKNETIFFQFFFNHLKHEHNECTRFRIDNDDEFIKMISKIDVNFEKFVSSFSSLIIFK